jgi:hypothetical protein
MSGWHVLDRCAQGINSVAQKGRKSTAKFVVRCCVVKLLVEVVVEVVVYCEDAWLGDV